MAEIPLFPLPLVIFPGGKLPLQIFETRYLDMIKRCMREDAGFGVIMIAEGDQILRNPDQQLPAIEHCGTYCTVIDFDELPNGMLGVMVQGQKKFVVRDEYERPDRLMMGDVEFLAEEEEIAMPEDHEHLSGLLESLMSHEAVQQLRLDCDLGQAVDVGSRLTELLPCPNDFKQRMLEMKDPLVRLAEIDKLVEQIQKEQN